MFAGPLVSSELLLNKCVFNEWKGLGRIYKCTWIHALSKTYLPFSIEIWEFESSCTQVHKTLAHKPHLIPDCFCMACELRIVLVFLNGWGGNPKKNYNLVTTGNYSKFIKFYWNSATLICLLLLTGAFMLPAEAEWLWQRPSGWHGWKYLLCGLLQKEFTEICSWESKPQLGRDVEPWRRPFSEPVYSHFLAYWPSE